MWCNVIAYIVTLTLSLLAAPFAANAQPAGKIPRIGFLLPGAASGPRTGLEAFRQGLRDLGYIEGQHLAIEAPNKEQLMQSSEFIEVETNVRLHIRDWGQGQPIVFIHGWPLSHAMYEYQFTQLPQHGYRCMGMTLRGFGQSSKPWGAYNYDVFADDVKHVLEALDLRDVTLAGFSMGGAIALHYMARHRGERVSKLALFGAAAPSFTKRPGFPYGLEPSAIDGFIEACHTDRAKLNEDFGKIFFRSENAVSPKLGEWFHNMGMEASPYATAACLVALRDTDLRDDMAKVTVPTVIFHATQDKICLFELAEAMAAGIKGAQLIRFENSGHGLFYEEKEKFNTELMNFVG